jgi:transcriptional regulator with XRE-family HTH domain
MSPVDPHSRRIGQRVRVEREKAELSHADLAALTGLTKAYLVRLETAGGNPTIEALGAIADALDLTIADLVQNPRLTLTFAEADVAPSLRAYADDAGLTSTEVRMLASIRWRDGDEPRSEARWRYVHDSLRISKALD